MGPGAPSIPPLRFGAGAELVGGVDDHLPVERPAWAGASSMTGHGTDSTTTSLDEAASAGMAAEARRPTSAASWSRRPGPGRRRRSRHGRRRPR